MNRTELALNAITTLSDRLGIKVSDSTLLCDSHHVTLRISSDLVARVLIGEEKNGKEQLTREIEVSKFLAHHGAPVTQPTNRCDPGPHAVDGTFVTLWKFEKVERPKSDVPDAAYEALAECHRHLENYEADLPDFRESLEECFEALQGEDARRFLKSEDHQFLADCSKILNAELDRKSFCSRPLHGGCHTGNVLEASRGFLWTDFENVCMGPIEWGLTCVPRPFRAHYAFEPSLLELLGDLRSWTVSVWCWTIYDRSDEKREAAHYHLERLREKSAASS